MNLGRYFASTAAVLAIASPAAAEVRLGSPFTDHAVIQRDRPVSVWGSANPGERVSVTFGANSKSAKADRSGEWQVELPAMSAGGPHRLVAAGAKGDTAEASDILIGDVWLCSGQSNMEWPVNSALNRDWELSSATDPELRVMHVPQRFTMGPEARFPDDVVWQMSSEASIRDFSAACYFMVRELRQTQKVPIGAIDSSWGGTRVRPWTSEEAVRASGDKADADMLSLYRRDRAAGARAFVDRWGAWWREQSGDAAGSEPWRAADRLSWQRVPQISPWEQWGDPALADFNGQVWLRRKVTLTEAEAASGGTLSLGVVDDIDTTWINGVGIGSSHGWSYAREYAVPKGLLRAGENEILVAAIDSWGPGGFMGPADVVKLALGNGQVKPIGDGWEYSVVSKKMSPPPRAPWDSHAGVGVIYNAMIAPLRDYGLKGVAWYQGESDSGVPGYEGRLMAWMKDWRRQFEAPNLPFLIVSLANFETPAPTPVASGWAEVRDQQRRAAAAAGDAAVVIAMDVGDRLELHPPNKQEVGRRLARAAKALAYGGSEPPSGPEIVRARRTGDGIVLEFKGVTGRLHSWSSNRPIGFELCGETQASCRFVDATAAGSQVRIADDGQPATRVRYAWADSPIVNLYDEAPLPAGPFEVPIE